MRRVVEAAEDLTIAVDDELGDRRVVGADEREAARADAMGEELADHAAVDDCDDGAVRIRSDDPPEAGLESGVEVCV